MSEKMNEIIKQLSKPFPIDELYYRIGVKSKKKDKATALWYVTKQMVIERLNEVVGAENWCDEYKEWHSSNKPELNLEALKIAFTKEKYDKDGEIIGETFDRKNYSKFIKNYYGDNQICGLSIKIDGEWVTKWDGSDATNTEEIKGGLSDSFKRAATKWGIALYLYLLGKYPSFYYSIDSYGNFVDVPKLPKEFINKFYNQKDYKNKVQSEELLKMFDAEKEKNRILTEENAKLKKGSFVPKTEAQRKQLFALVNEKKLDNQIKLIIAEKFDVSSSKDLDRKQTAQLIDDLKNNKF